MAGSTRIVERLRLRADSESAVRRTTLALQDAFRTATLPGDGARVICIRRLHLWRLPAEASPQTLSLLVESRFSGTDWTMRHGGDENAHEAEAVWFADALEAHQVAAVRLAGGRALTEWFWPLALPDVARTDAPDQQLRAIAFAVAVMEEAPRALPSWIVALIEAGHREQVLAALHPGDGCELARMARVSGFDALMRALAARRPESEDPASTDVIVPPTAATAVVRNVGSGSSDPGRAIPTVPVDDRVAFVELVMRRDAVAESILRRRVTARRTHTLAPDSRTAHSAAVPHLERQPTAGSPTQASTPAQQHSSASSECTVISGPGETTSAQPTGTPGERRIDSTHESHLHAWPLPDGEPTIAGGLLFLFPVLERLGFAAWAATRAPEEPDPEVLTGQILHLLLSRLRVEEDDPIWALAASFRLKPEATQSARPEGAERASNWLTLCRRYLRRRVQIGLASLVCRPARLTITRTHVDVLFRLDAADFRIRRAGLDLDPGWLPWFGRVVAFHYAGR